MKSFFIAVLLINNRSRKICQWQHFYNALCFTKTQYRRWQAVLELSKSRLRNIAGNGWSLLSRFSFPRLGVLLVSICAALQTDGKQLGPRSCPALPWPPLSTPSDPGTWGTIVNSAHEACASSNKVCTFKMMKKKEKSPHCHSWFKTMTSGKVNARW